MFELERKLPGMSGYMGGYYLTPWIGFWFLLFAALGGAMGERLRPRRHYGRRWSKTRGYYMPRTWWYEEWK